MNEKKNDTIPVKMTDSERIQKAVQLTDVMAKIKALAAQKSSLSRSIKAMTETQDKLAVEVRTGEKEVDASAYQMALDLGGEATRIEGLPSAWESASPVPPDSDDDDDDDEEDDDAIAGADKFEATKAELAKQQGRSTPKKAA